MINMILEIFTKICGKNSQVVKINSFLVLKFMDFSVFHSTLTTSQKQLTIK